MKQQRITVRGIELDVLSAGEGGRPMLYVHGFAGRKEDFADHLDAVAALGFHCVAPDHRGHGRSTHPEGEDAYSFAEIVADLLALADSLGWGSFVLLGLSMGGMIAQELVLTHPDRVDALILMSTSHACPDGLDHDAIEAGRSFVRAKGLGALVEVERERGSVLSTPAHERLLETRPGYREYGEEGKLMASAEMWCSLIAEIRDAPDRLERLRAGVTVPTLVIAGEQDKPFVGHARRMAEAISGAELVVVADAGHSPQFENPEPWFAALRGFLSSLPSEVRS